MFHRQKSKTRSLKSVHRQLSDETMKIILDDNDIYQAGQFVRGNLVVNLTTDVPLNECNIRLFCMADVGWTENPGIRDEGRSYHVQRKLLEMSHMPEGPNCKWISVYSILDSFGWKS